MKIERIEPNSTWFFAFWADIRDDRGRLLRFPSISLGIFRIVKDTDAPWWAGWLFYWNND